MPWISAAAGIAAVDSLRDYGIEARLKWPNDILVHEYKVGGLIAHAGYEAGGSATVIVGLGLNLRGARADFQALGLHHASSVEAETGEAPPPVRAVAELWLAWLNNRLVSLARIGPSALLDPYRELLADVGKFATVRTADMRQIQGYLRGVTDHGELRVQTREGEEETVLAGIVEWQ